MLPRSKDYSLCYLPHMSISRRGFFRGLTGKGEDRHSERQRRVLAVESWVRTYLFPYDFALTAEQSAEALAAAVAGIEIDSEQDPLSVERRRQMSEIIGEKIERWRDEYLKAEAVRRDANPFVREFLSAEASPEDVNSLRNRFHVPDPAILEEEIERQIQVWLGGLSNSRLASCDGAALRELVLSELRSWC